MTTITKAYSQHAKIRAEKTAILTEDKDVTYREWAEAVERTAAWLQSRDSGNRTIGILLPNGIDFLQFFAGAAMAGWNAVPYDMKWKTPELQKRVALSKPSIIVTTEKSFNYLNEVFPEVRKVGDCLQEIAVTHVTTITPPGDNPPFYTGFTSGTTGSPKAFVRSHDSWVKSFECSVHDFGLDETVHALIPGSLFHSHFLYGAISTLHLGGTVYLLNKFSPSQTMEWLGSCPITALYVVPTMVEAFLKEGQSVERTFKLLSSGAKWTEESKAIIGMMFPAMEMIEFYGAGELSFVSFLTGQDGQSKTSTVGKPCRHVEIEIRDRSGGVITYPDEVGKIHVRSPFLIDGYYEEEDGTIEGIRDKDGWATVHDMGKIDKDGFLTIEGREKNMIMYGGINLFPEEIETVLARHPGVEEVAVIGMPDTYWGQIAVAVVVGHAEKLELKRFCKGHLAGYKVPRRWLFVPSLPYTTSGKVARAELRRQLESTV
ncbi:AMP-binding protein [Rossellomorea marisflavi]|uniref:Acyl-CoA synthetase n=1 Tax=Rossellomorea marisflavi TaxID=189381 RepID=A0A163J3C2_9BACI|nr:AMP-binding protein [Rossellomorea marisflavi]KZE44267.1 acyl-CoA synthetase [Rossellomorea marisflavi]